MWLALAAFFLVPVGFIGGIALLVSRLPQIIDGIHGMVLGIAGESVRSPAALKVAIVSGMMLVYVLVVAL